VSTDQQETTYLDEAVEAAVMGPLTGNLSTNEVHRLLQRVEPYFATHYEQKGAEGERLRLNATFNGWASQRLASSGVVAGEIEKAKLRVSADAYRNAADYVLDADPDHPPEEDD
jgi:hypothetical protein